jgi:hypothetical protein
MHDPAVRREQVGDRFGVGLGRDRRERPTYLGGTAMTCSVTADAPPPFTSTR